MKNKLSFNKSVMLVLSIISMMFLSGCNTSNVDDNKINVVVTTGMIGDIVKNIAAQNANVITLMGSGVDPHLYKASEGDVSKLQNADIIFYNGLHLEAKMSEIFEKMSATKKTVAVSSGIPKEMLISSDLFQGQIDPHIWFDVTLWILASEKVRDELVAYDPAHKVEYEKNAEEYIEKLNNLHKSIKDKIMIVPQNQRVLVTAHDAFSYFGRQYGFEVMGLQGISTASEAGAKDVQNLAGFISKRKIKAIFIESSVPKRNIEAVQDAVIAKEWNVNIGGLLYSDAMGDYGTTEGTYVGMVTHNIDTIVNALK